METRRERAPPAFNRKRRWALGPPNRSLPTPLSIIQQTLHVLPGLRSDDRRREIQRLGHEPLHLRYGLLDDVARFVEARTAHGDGELERTRATARHRHETEQKHLGELDDALCGAAQRQHLENRRPSAHVTIRTADRVA